MKLKELLFIFLITLFLFSSCKYNFDGINNFLAFYTETSGITEYKITSNNKVIKMNDGYLYISSNEDLVIDFHLRNPENFQFNDNNMSFNLISLDEKIKDTINLNNITLKQNTNKSIVTLTYPIEILMATENGFDISPKINLQHPETMEKFSPYNDLKIKSDSPPQAVYGAVVYEDSERYKYTILFNMPSKGLLSGIHKDICKIEIINGSKSVASNIKIDEDGSFSFDNNEFFFIGEKNITTDDKINFEVFGQPAYFLSDDNLSGEIIDYKIRLIDKNNLQTDIITSIQSTQLDKIKVYDINNNELTELNLKQDDGSSYATVTFKAPKEVLALNGEIKDTSNSHIIYEVYQGKDDTGKVLLNGKNETGEITLQLPAGQNYIRVYSHKDGFADSKPIELNIHVLRTTLYVSSTGDDTNNNGSKNSPYKTITKATTMFDNPEANYYLFINDDLTENFVITNNTSEIYNITIEGNNNIINLGENTNTTNISENINLTLRNTEINGDCIFNGNKLIFDSTSKINGITKIKNDNATISITEDYKTNNLIQCKIYLDCLNRNDRTLIIAKNLSEEILESFELNTNGYYLEYNSEKNLGIVKLSGITVSIKDIDDLILEIFGLIVKDNIYIINNDADKEINFIVKNISNNNIDNIESINFNLIIDGDIIYNSNTKEITIPRNTKIGNYILAINFIYNETMYSCNLPITIEQTEGEK